MSFDKFHDECGVFGIFGSPDAAAHTALGLHALQHRGQEAAGIVSTDGEVQPGGVSESEATVLPGSTPTEASPETTPPPE